MRPIINPPHRIVEKQWGREVWIHNDEKYCGKILVILAGKRFSMHFHMIKEETWYVHSGELKLTWIDTDDASRHEEILMAGSILEIPRGLPHQLEAMVDSQIIEVSTQHFDSDSYRIEPGNNQL